MGRIAFWFLGTCVCELWVLIDFVTRPFDWKLMIDGLFFLWGLYGTAYYLIIAKLRIK